jgi:hypothetical protein
MIHVIISERWLIVHDRGDTICAGDVGAGNDDKLIPRYARLVRYVANPRSRLRTADGGAVQHAWHDQIRNVLCGPGKLALHFLPSYGRADYTRLHVLL